MKLFKLKVTTRILVTFFVFALGACKNNALASNTPYLKDETLQPSIHTANTSSMETPSYTIISDKSILFEAEANSTICQGFDVPFRVTLSFTNLTNNTIKFADQFKLADNRKGYGGNLIPTITLNGKDVYSAWENSMRDIPLPIIESYFEIPPRDTVSKEINFYFPEALLETWTSNSEVVATPSSGRYSIKFSYYQSKQPFVVWDGFLLSNQFEICLKTGK